MKKSTLLLTAIPLMLAASAQAQSWGFTLGNGAGFYFGNGGGNQRCNNRPAYVAPARSYYNQPAVVYQQQPVYVQQYRPAPCQQQVYYPAPVYYAPARQPVYDNERRNHSNHRRGYSNLW